MLLLLRAAAAWARTADCVWRDAAGTYGLACCCCVIPRWGVLSKALVAVPALADGLCYHLYS
jgi:hypothetical protein